MTGVALPEAPPGYELVRADDANRWAALSRVTNPHVARVVDVATVGGEPFAAYERGTRTARQWLAEGKRSDVEIIRVWWNILTGLAALHRDQLVHGRVTPDHAFVEANGRVFIGAFSRELDLGSPYAAPELVRHQPATAKTDQFGVAASLREALPKRKRIADILARAMSPDPDQRFVSVTAFGNMLVQS